MNLKLLTGIEFSLIVWICYVSYVNGLSCLFCDRAVNVTDCLTQIASCQDRTEECFLDWQVLPDLSAVLSAGCRSKQVCNLISSAFGKRASKRTLGCSQCCNSPPNSKNVPCNGYLCEQAPVAAGTACGICDRVSDPKDCSVDQTCQPSETCIVKTLFTGGVLKYELGCEQKFVCDLMLKEYKNTHSSHTGKRADHGDLVLCAACCDGLGCNKNQCSEVIKNQPCFNSTICG
ncbi:unnamed protein product [Mytilus coruscus]|uniref:UPAR/Ly6 domain-containing protein n=1 Tax=Mytilus coruscus TaxID=42192 RepID=A0A6J8ESA2_MYTCO|nr:unnamed protein product [Mytilus coruscus]